MQRDISTHLQDWTSFSDPALREQEYSFRRAAARETSVAVQHPINEYDALMRTPPGDEPAETLGDIQALRDVIVDAIDQLTPQHRYVIDAINSERLSYGQLARRLGISKTYAYKLTNQAKEQLRLLLAANPLVKERITMKPTTWNEAARQALHDIAPVGLTIADTMAELIINAKIKQLRAEILEGNHRNSTLNARIQSIGVAAASMLDNRGLWDIDEITAMLCRKQHDYGHDNINAFGMVGIVVRCSDKVARWTNLAGDEGQAEPAIDALLDMVGYAAIAHMLTNDTFMLELDTVEANA